MADPIEISPIFRQAIEDEKNRVPLASTPTATAPTPPGPLERLWSSIVSSNPVSAIKSGLQEWYHRPEAIHDMQMALAAERRIRAGRAQPGDQELLDKGSAAAGAHYQAPGGPIVPMYSEPAIQAANQMQQGDIAGGIGTGIGAYGGAAALGAAVPPLARTAARAGRWAETAVPGGLKGAWSSATEPIEVPIRLPGGRTQVFKVPKSVVSGGAGAVAGKYMAGEPGKYVGATLGAGAPILRGMITGAKKTLDAQAAARAAAEAPVPVPPTILPQLGSGPPVYRQPPGLVPPDTSFVRGVPAEYGTEPIPPARQLPAAPRVFEQPPAKDPSFVRGVQAEYPPSEAPPKPPAPPPMSAQELMEQVPGLSPEAAEAMAREIANAPPPKPPAPPPPKPAPQPKPAPKPKPAPAPEPQPVATPAATAEPEPAATEEPDLTGPLEASIQAAKAKKAAPAEPAAAPAAPEGGRLYSKTKNPDQELNSQVHANLLDIFGRKNKPSLSAAVNEIYGTEGKDSFVRLHVEDKSAINQFLLKNRRLPTPQDIENGTFAPPRNPYNYHQGGPLRYQEGGTAGNSTSHRIAEELHNQGLHSTNANMITPEEWGDLSRAAGANAPGQYSIRDVVNHMQSLEGPAPTTKPTPGMRTGGTMPTRPPLHRQDGGSIPGYADILRRVPDRATQLRLLGGATRGPSAPYPLPPRTDSMESAADTLVDIGDIGGHAENLGGGLAGLIREPTWEGKAQQASRAIRGGMGVATPFMLPA